MSIIKVITHRPDLGPKPKRARPVGLGDVVAFVAQPIARAIDSMAHTQVAQCGGCKKRQEALNNLIPNINPFQ